jgi:hypothetical protein
VSAITKAKPSSLSRRDCTMVARLRKAYVAIGAGDVANRWLRVRCSPRRRPGTKCLEYVRKRSPSRRDGVMCIRALVYKGRLGIYSVPCWSRQRLLLNHPVPPGRIASFYSIPGHFVPGYSHESLRDTQPPEYIVSRSVRLASPLTNRPSRAFSKLPAIITIRTS